MRCCSYCALSNRQSTTKTASRAHLQPQSCPFLVAPQFCCLACCPARSASTPATNAAAVAQQLPDAHTPHEAPPPPQWAAAAPADTAASGRSSRGAQSNFDKQRLQRRVSCCSSCTARQHHQQQVAAAVVTAVQRAAAAVVAWRCRIEQQAAMRCQREKATARVLCEQQPASRQQRATTLWQWRVEHSESQTQPFGALVNGSEGGSWCRLWHGSRNT